MMGGVGSPQSKLPGETWVRMPFSRAGGVAQTTESLSSSSRLEFASQLAKSRRVQSQLKGLSARDRLLSLSFDVGRSVVTILMSLSSSRRFSRLRSGTTRSPFSERRKLCVRSRIFSFSRWASEELETATMPLYARSRCVRVDRYLNASSSRTSICVHVTRVVSTRGARLVFRILIGLLLVIFTAF
jgi:hypothetical protein